MTTVLVTSEKTRPSESQPIKRMGTCLEIRPLRRTFLSVILATWEGAKSFTVSMIADGESGARRFRACVARKVPQKWRWSRPVQGIRRGSRNRSEGLRTRRGSVTRCNFGSCEKTRRCSPQGLKPAASLTGEQRFLAGDDLPAALAVDVDLNYAGLAAEAAAILRAARGPHR